MKQTMKRTIIILGVVVVAAIGIAAYNPSYMQGQQQAVSGVALACSSDGRTVYVADLNGVWKSEDGGRSWFKVTPK